MPCKSGCPSGVRRGVYGVVGEVCPTPDEGVSVQTAARANMNPVNQRLTRTSS